MVRFEVRLYGDPLTREQSSADLREFLARAEAAGMSCAVCLSAARGEQEGRVVHLTDGVAPLSRRTPLSPEELSGVLAASNNHVAPAAPLVVFGENDLHRQALLEFPEACAAQLCRDVPSAMGWLNDLLADLRPEYPSLAFELAALAPCLELSPPTGGEFVHVGGSDPVWGTDLVVRSFARMEDCSNRLLVFAPDGSRPDVPIPADVEFIDRLPNISDLGRAHAVVQPYRRVDERDWQWILASMAASRPLILSSCAATNQVLDSVGTFLPVGGRMIGSRFEPDPRLLTYQMGEVLRTDQRNLAERARSHVLRRHLVYRSCSRTPKPPNERPTLVLEAPLFETSSSSVLTIETARALVRRGRIDVRLRPTAPFREGFSEFADRHPELVPHLCRTPAAPDLWLSAGWPVRVRRPDTRRFAVRFDWEYGALPAELSPALTQEVDAVVVHSEHVRRTLAASGRSMESVVRVPHGVDPGVFHEDAQPLEEVQVFKRGRRAILFVGGLIWRKGFDLVIKALVEGFDRSDPICLVVKPLGSQSSYRSHNLAALVDRVRAFPNAPEIHVIDRRLSAEEMAGLYSACDILLHPYRGEGFCMPVLEARSCGLPVLITEGGSTDDFCVGDSCVQIPSSVRFIDLPGVHVGRPFVFEADWQALLRLLRQMLGRLGQLRDVARQEARDTRAEYSWDRAAGQLERLTFEAAGQHRLLPT